mmetsp:Transcript_46215/g.98042  ORF Transcript_46215/g.98042 Transcript_46215/m.98042 type:complete len:258 (-) Transcript_46215:352-1125(-)|eukprot:CAMPEP_0172532754 /NCGR_PEP_ID=MMETSP1067-20121228/5690_1 /TAXON_ID=265564 ORGANISM="Thalassiosira punctigera, Strain Tpunct2005C2" /NCGR_SAMPLE_ID=MMETSP1067 /ASSEMBLY_ACC=CAM_ASM_000444 /LENGTH=257 /DNA_ID=CAMNT_0013317305 /DNA_START=80 /DNA_END=853 /DNA_ORIENTATION=-
MFSANENILLRQHKRRVIEYIDSTIPDNALELGTTVMVMQVSCRQPGCVPLETAITVVFPKPPTKKKKKKRSSKDIGIVQQQQTKDEIPAFPQPLLPDLEESRIGGSFKTRILKPLSDVTLDDVLEALPPSFKGGRRTTESLCLKARDMTFAQIGQLVGNDDTEDSKEGRRLVAEYLKVCLEEYVERGCVAPEWGENFDPFDSEEKKEDRTQREETDTYAKKETPGGKGNDNASMDDMWGKGNFVFRRPDEENEDGK